MLRIGTEPTSSGMGDVLLLTAICKHIQCQVDLHPNASRYARFFRDIAEVTITDTPTVTPNIGWGHYTERKFNGLGILSDDILPEIKLSHDEKVKIKILTQKYHDWKVFVPNCSLHWSHVREMPPATWEKVIQDQQSKVIQFGLSSNYTKIKGVDEVVLDASIEELIVYYAAIGRYIGVDTGDYHLMLAVGGIAEVYYPPDNPYYHTDEWHYRSDRVKYLPFV